MRSIVLSIFYGFVDMIFPSKCVCCGTNISIRYNSVCGKCLDEIDFIENECGICSGVLIDGICDVCSGRKFYIERNIAVADYSGVMKSMLHNYKFSSRRRLASHLTGAALEKIHGHSGLFDIISAVPMNRRKKWKRGFNQSEIIARQISKKLGKKYRSLLKERPYFKTQRDLGLRERFLNVLERYEIINERMVEGKRILLVDDVFTTGATINECARILKSFGANEVYSLTIARVVVKRLEKK